jgi:thiamine-monophosphate kinase
MNTTDLNKIGEFGIVDFINSKFKNKRNSSIVGIGDDAAIIKSNKENIVISS